MPSIKKGESRESYISRCIPYVMKNEGLTSNQAAGKCEGMYSEHLKKHNSKADKTWQESLFSKKEDK